MNEFKKRVRSPAHPGIDLSGAITRAQQLYEREHRTPAPITAVAEAWGWSESSSAVSEAVAALKYFGLADVEGSGMDRTVRISDLGFDILIEDVNSKAYDSAIQAAALRPEVYRQLWEHFGMGGSSTNKRTFLLRMGFNQKSVMACIQNYDRSIQFAELTGSDMIAPLESGESSSEFDERHEESMPTVVRESPVVRHMAPPGISPRGGAGSIPVSILRDDGTVQVVYLPKMTAKEFAFFKDQLAMFERAILIRTGGGISSGTEYYFGNRPTESDDRDE